MSYGLRISSAIGSDDITDFLSFRIFAIEVKTESVTSSPQTFSYTGPTGWTTSNGTFYVLPNSSGILPNFSLSGTNQIIASFSGINSIYKANSWRIFWLVKTGNDTPSGYGALIANASGNTVINNDTQTMLAESSGTLSSFTTTNSGARKFGVPSGFLPTDSAIFVKLVDGTDLYFSSRDTYPSSQNLNLLSTTATSLEYFVIRGSFSLATPTGYGMSIFSGTGNLVYNTSYDIFPSNGQTFTVEDSITTSTTVDGTKDVWVNLNFGTPAPFCPDGGAGSFPTFNFIAGVTRSGSTIGCDTISIVNTPPSTDAVATAHKNTALIVQR